MIQTQVDDFLKQIKNLEEIQVVRKLHSITLQVDQDSIMNNVTESNDCDKSQADENEVHDYEEVLSEVLTEEEEDEEEIEDKTSREEDIVVIVSDCSQCPKCDEITTSNERCEIHEFFKHSLLGTQIENEAEVSQEMSESLQRKCGTCLAEFDEPTAFAYHLVVEHSSEILTQVNQLFGVNEVAVNLNIINKYISHVKELICDGEGRIDERVKQYFYQIYSGEAGKQIEEDDEEETENFSTEMFEESTEVIEFKQPKSVKNTVNLSNLDDESREWVRNEINTRKKHIENEFGVARVIYRCAYCNIYSSNSAPGFRYHLISKHLKENDIRELREVQTENVIPPMRSKIGRNTCDECNLKFKDQKMLISHRNSHELFETISQYYCFPACHTCNSLYIDESSLNIHLNKHDANKDVTQPILVPSGAIIIQGKRVAISQNTQEVPSKEFSWRCGHCTRKFSKEPACRLHLLMVHASIFTCPMDKREFSGFKAVSLFCHHLRNKHPEIFPDMMFPCTFCNLEFTSIYDKLFHMKSCSEKKFECDHCHKKFFKKGDLVSHLKFISGELFFQCKMCKKKCETLSDLKIHERTHTKEKPFPCAICNKSFRTLAARSAHIESHNTNVLYTVRLKYF